MENHHEKLYSLFNLNVRSAIPLPEALCIEENSPDAPCCDVTVRYGDVKRPRLSSDDAKPLPFYFHRLSESHMVFCMPGGMYEMCEGARITVEPAKDATDATVRTFLLGSAFGALQYQRGRIPLHGGAVASGGKAVMFTAAQGVGKSTMVSALVAQGLSYLTDDVVAIEMQDGTPLAMPSYPQRKLVKDACIRLGYSPESLPLVDMSRQKYAIRDAKSWHSSPLPLGMIVQLIPSPNDTLSVKELSATECIGLIQHCLYRPWLHIQDGRIPPKEMKRLFEIASCARMVSVSVPRNIDKISEIAARFCEALKL